MAHHPPPHMPEFRPEFIRPELRPEFIIRDRPEVVVDSFGMPVPIVVGPRASAGIIVAMLIFIIFVIVAVVVTAINGSGASGFTSGSTTPRGWPRAAGGSPHSAQPLKMARRQGRREKYGPPPGMARSISPSELPYLYGDRGWADGPREMEGSSAGAMGAYIERSA